MNDHGRALANILNIGTAAGENNAMRAFANVNSESGDVSEIVFYAKKHKKRLPNGDPKTRPVAEARDTMTSRTAELTGRPIECAIKARDEEKLELISQEELLAELEDTEKIVPEVGKRVVVGSLDVEALYPALDIEIVARECAEEIIESGIEFIEVDTHKAGIYLKINNSEEDNTERKINHLLPERKSNKGRKPGIRTKELRRRSRVKNKGEEEVKEIYHEEIDDTLKDDSNKNEQDTKEDDESKWWPGKKPSNQETTRLIA